MPTVKKIKFANGTTIAAPEDLTLESSSNKLPVYANDGAYTAENPLEEGSIYLNSTLKAPRLYLGGVWRNGIVQENPTDSTKTVKFDLDGASPNADHILDFNGTVDRTYTFPDVSATVVLTLGAQELQDKTIKNGFLDGTKIRNGALDVEAAGALTIGATVGANNLTLGGAGSTVQIPGNLTVSGSTTTVNTTTLDVKDVNITVNKGGDNASSEGSGITVDRTGTKGSLIYKDSAPNKFAIGALSSEKNVAVIDDITASNFTGTLIPSKGGTGVANNDAATLTRTGNHALTLTTTGVTGVTLPTTGTLSTLNGSEVLLNKTTVSSTNATTGALKIPVGNATSERPTGTAAELKGMIRYNDIDDSFEGYNELTGWSSIGGGGGGTTDRITQASHGFVVGDVLYLNGATYTKARADAANTAEVVGVVSRIIDASQFELTLSGEISGLTGLVAGEVYFLSATTSGALTVTEPTVVGQVSLPVGVASSTTSLYVAPKRGVVVGGANARTNISLLNAPTVNNIQDVSAYDAGELSGWVSISATIPLRFYVSTQFSKNGAGNNYNISYQTSGDAPPAGFLVSITSAGLIQIQLATSAISGFTSATINYALNAPAVGTSLPLSIDAGSITSGTFTRGSFSSGIETKGAVEVGFGRSSDGAAYVDLISQASESDFNARLIRYSGISGDLELNNSSGLVKFSITGVTKASVNSIGNFALDGLTHGSSNGCLTAKGIQGRQGTSGSSAGNPYNFFWSGSLLQAWVDGTNIGNVTISSDYRAKKNIETQNLTAIDRVMALRPVKYEFADYKELFKADGVEREGFIAHEVAAVIPSAVDGEKDAEDQVQSLKLDALVSVLTKAIQELKTELDSVKSELESLKNK